MNAGLAGRTAVVTGASRGIGAAIAQALAQRGAELALLARNVAPLEALASRLPVRALAVAADVSDPDSVRAAFARIREQLPRIDILVNNAGQARSAPFTRTDFALWQSMLAVNLNGAFLCTHEVYPAMVKQDYGRNSRGFRPVSGMQITVLDRPSLEQLFCECYAAVKKEIDRLLH